MQLSRETCLYTRLAICECLEKGSRETALKMIALLGKIGKNQHKVVPDRVSAKKSFPLPRDLIARTLGRMNPIILPDILSVLTNGTTEQTREALDAVGYLVFYHQELATVQNCQRVLKAVSYAKADPLILWKVLICLSAFSCEEGEQFLLRYSKEDSQLGKEAQRSLDIIQARRLYQLRRSQANPDCPCRWKNCSRFGLCEECREHHCHSEKYPLPACERKKTKK